MEISQTRQCLDLAEGFIRPERTMEAPICHHTNGSAVLSGRIFLFATYQPLRSWLISGCPCGTRSMRLRFEFFYRFHATSAKGEMFWVRANVGFPMPATFAFLATCRKDSDTFTVRFI
jgi:hypothetical protein